MSGLRVSYVSCRGVASIQMGCESQKATCGRLLDIRARSPWRWPRRGLADRLAHDSSASTCHCSPPRKADLATIMVATDGSWQDITASYVRGTRPVGQEYGRHDGPPVENTPGKRPQGPRRPLPVPPLPEPVMTQEPLQNMDESELNVSSESWTSLHSDNPSQADTSTDSAGPDLPGAFLSSTMSKNLSSRSNLTEKGDKSSSFLHQQDEGDPFAPQGSSRPLSATSTNTSDSTVDSDWTPPIASGSQTPRRTLPKTRQYAVRSPRLARPAAVLSPYNGSRTLKSPVSPSGRAIDAQNTPRRRKGSSLHEDELVENRQPRRRRAEQNAWLPVIKGQ